MLFENCNTATLQQREQSDRKKIGKKFDFYSRTANPLPYLCNVKTRDENLLPHEAAKIPTCTKEIFHS